MNRPTAIPLSAFGGESRTTASGGINYRTCPICRSDKWKVYADLRKMVWMCFAGDHSAGGKIIGQPEDSCDSLLASMRQVDAATSFDMPEEMNQSVSLPPLRGPLDHVDRTILRHRYMLNNPDWFGITRGTDGEIVTDKDTLKEVPIPRFFIPYYDIEGRIVYYSGRRMFDALYPETEVLKYKNSKGPRRLYVPQYAPIVRRVMKTMHLSILFICEGPFDAMRINEASFDAVALGGKTLPASLKKVLLTTAAGYAIIIVLLDLDASTEAFELWHQLGNIFPPTTQIRLGQLSGKDAASLPQQQLTHELLALAKDVVIDVAPDEGINLTRKDGPDN